MASLRTGVQGLLRTSRTISQASRRLVHNGPQKSTAAAVGLRTGVGLAALGLAGYGTYTYYNHRQEGSTHLLAPLAVQAKQVPESQCTVFSPTKDHALYLTIHLTSKADAKGCARTVANIQRMVDEISPPDMRDEQDEVWAGVGFGPSFLGKVLGKAKKDYSYADRKGALGPMPATGGDIFIHAKSNEVSKLFELCQKVVASLPSGSVDKFEDIYSFVYKGGRDLSGFIDGTENPADDESRANVAVEKETGGSYVITQKWVHRMDTIKAEKPSTMEGWVGRSLDDSTELKQKSISSHVARMTGGANFEQKKQFEIVRQSMPYGSLSGKAGLFFIAYAASPDNLNFMLDRMVGKGSDKHCDDIMRLTDCVAGSYFYFPGVAELKKLA